MNPYTHIKKPYRARCVQWDGKNTGQIARMVESAEGEASEYNGDLLIRWSKPQGKYSIERMAVGDWLRVGENGTVKKMTTAELNDKYERIDHV